MPPITTFIKISPHTTLPLRIFINRKSIIKQQQSTIFETAISSLQTTNHKALVRLRTTSRLMVSNRQLRELVLVIKDELLSILFELSFESLKMKNFGGGKDGIKIRIEKDGWDINLIVKIKFIEKLRDISKFGGEGLGVGGMELLIRKPRASSSNKDGIEPMLNVEEEEENLRIPEEGEVVHIPSDDDEVEEKKSNLKYDYKNNVVLGRGVNIEVLKIPK